MGMDISLGMHSKNIRPDYVHRVTGTVMLTAKSGEPVGRRIDSRCRPWYIDCKGACDFDGYLNDHMPLQRRPNKHPKILPCQQNLI